MGQRSSVELQGASRLRSTLRKAGVDLSEMTATHKVIAGIVVKQASGLVPRRSNALAGSIRAGGTRTRAIARAGHNRATGVKYAIPIHWGWPKRGIKPTPFLAAAAVSSQPTWWKAYTSAVDRIISNIKGD